MRSKMTGGPENLVAPHSKPQPLGPMRCVRRRAAQTNSAKLAQTVRSVSPWAPLRVGTFRAMWIAVLVSNIGTWMQTVGAQWLLVHLPHAAILVSLVQTADYLPDVLFGLIGGALADIFDRRRLLIVVQVSMATVGVALAVLTYLGQMPPVLLLTFTFVIGCSSVFSNPAYQSLVPELVPRSELREASALGSISVNLARLIGPAVAGIVIADIGVAAVFGMNAVAFAFFGVVVVLWRPAASTTPKLTERFLSALRAGGRYVRNAPVVRRILARVALFLFPASILWALLPVVASGSLHLGAQGYGFLLGALGAGAIGGALMLPRVRRRFSSNALMFSASITYSAALAIVVLIPNSVVAAIVLIPAGAAWTMVLSDVNAELQLFLPTWVRARGFAMYQMVLFGSQAIGALVWGLIAEPLGLTVTFLIAVIVMLGSGSTIRWWPLTDTSDLDRSTVDFWPEPQLAFPTAPDGGPVVVKTVYTISADQETRFLEAMRWIRMSRLRTGATQWGLFRDGENPRSFVELFVVPSWEEHLLQHRNRQTATDRVFEERANALSEPVPVTSHLIAVDSLE